MSRLLLGAMLCMWAVPAGAQASADPEESCLAGIPASALTRVPVHLEASADSWSGHVLPTADTIMLFAARVIRASLATGDTLPHADDLVHWRQLGADLQVAIHRDGLVSWSVPARADRSTTPGTAPDTAFNPARNIVAQALAAVREAGMRVTWPAGAAGDSVVFRLGYVRPTVSKDGVIQPITARFALPVFALPVPWERKLAPGQGPRVRYPDMSRSGGAEGKVILRFVVDTSGRVKRETIEEQWDTGRPRLGGQLGEYYDEFVQAAIRGVQEAKFVPALIGGCAVSQVAEMPFEFHLRRPPGR